MTSLFSNRERKEIAIGLLKGRSCDNCLYYGCVTSSNTYDMEMYMNEWCLYSSIDKIPNLKICKSWKGWVQ